MNPLDFIIANAGSFIVGALLFGIVLAILWRMYKKHKAGNTSCGCGCTNCPSASICHKK